MDDLKIKDKIGKLSKDIIPLQFQTRPMTAYVKKLQKKGELSNDITFVEVGSALCNNAENILHHIKLQDLFLVDPYLDGEKRYNIAKRKANFFPHMKLIRQTSEKAVKSFKDNSVDVVYIDGNHNYSYVLQDIEIWYPKVKKGGVIGGHDFRGHALGVILAVVDFVDRNKLRDKLQSGGVDWWIRK